MENMGKMHILEYFKGKYILEMLTINEQILGKISPF